MTAILSLSIIILLDFSLLKSVVIRGFFDSIKYLDSLRTSFKKVFTSIDVLFSIFELSYFEYSRKSWISPSILETLE